MTNYKPQLIAMALAFCLVLLLGLLPANATRSTKMVFGALLLPLFGITSSTAQIRDSIAPWSASRKQLINQLQELTLENRRLKTESLQLRAMLKENAELREALSWKERTQWELVPARIIGRDPKTWWNTIQIDRGSLDGVEVDMPVFVKEGAVGKVAETSLHRSRVALLSDPNCSIAAMVKETRETGFIQPSRDSLLAPNKVALSFLRSSVTTRPGHEVVTSELSRIFPSGIPIGKVMDTELIGFGLYVEARVELAVDPGKLDLVWIKIR